jgi:hypothetical protein
MAGRFPQEDVEKLLVACHRCCCVCHRYCGVKIEIDHMQPGYDDGDDTIENAIAVCFECHAEVHMYNDAHPRGRKFRPSELREHKLQWLRLCERNPPALRTTVRSQVHAAGPIEALINELEFNRAIARAIPAEGGGVTSPLRDRQFQRAMTRGAISVLREDVKNSIFDAYASIGAANQEHRRVAIDTQRSTLRTGPANGASKRALPSIEAALDALMKHLGDGATTAAPGSVVSREQGRGT